MQGVLTSREAWTRFASALLQSSEMDPSEIAEEADLMLVEYLSRFPDPPGLESAKLAVKRNATRVRFTRSLPGTPEES